MYYLIPTGSRFPEVTVDIDLAKSWSKSLVELGRMADLALNENLPKFEVAQFDWSIFPMLEVAAELIPFTLVVTEEAHAPHLSVGSKILQIDKSHFEVLYHNVKNARESVERSGAEEDVPLGLPTDKEQEQATEEKEVSDGIEGEGM